MKNRSNMIAAALAALLAFGAGAASAQGAYPYRPHNGYSATPHVDQRQAQQQRRIHQGMRSGQLTHHEARRLERQQAAIRHMERRARADGVVTPHERRQIAAAQARASRSIRNQKHDVQRY